MKSELVSGMASYSLASSEGYIALNDLVGKKIQLRHTGIFFCVNHKGPIKKTFGEGLCWKCFSESASASPCIIHPEQCRIHEGIALRGDLEWEIQNHMQEHVVYLSQTSGLKVGVTRASNLFSRWIDQGARQGIILAQVPYRQLAGELEVFLKAHVSDKTNWKAMLSNQSVECDLKLERERLIELIPDHYQDYIDFNSQSFTIEYPVISYPLKPVALKLDKVHYEGILKGVLGQYLLLENNLVFNIRGNSGMEIEFLTEE